MPFDNRKNILEDLFSSVLSQLKKYHPSGNLKFNYLGIFQSLKLRILMEKSFGFPLLARLNFTPNSLGYYGLSCVRLAKVTVMYKKFASTALIVVQPAIIGEVKVRLGLRRD